MSNKMPISGGSYSADPDGSLTLLGRTGERECACRNPPVAETNEAVEAEETLEAEDEESFAEPDSRFPWGRNK